MPSLTKIYTDGIPGLRSALSRLPDHLQEKAKDQLSGFLFHSQEVDIENHGVATFRGPDGTMRIARKILVCSKSFIFIFYLVVNSSNMKIPVVASIVSIPDEQLTING